MNLLLFIRKLPLCKKRACCLDVLWAKMKCCFEAHLCASKSRISRARTLQGNIAMSQIGFDTSSRNGIASTQPTVTCGLKETKAAF